MGNDYGYVASVDGGVVSSTVKKFFTSESSCPPRSPAARKCVCARVPSHGIITPVRTGTWDLVANQGLPVGKLGTKALDGLEPEALETRGFVHVLTSRSRVQLPTNARVRNGSGKFGRV
jgi:hypothetical protein